MLQRELVGQTRGSCSLSRVKMTTEALDWRGAQTNGRLDKVVPGVEPVQGAAELPKDVAKKGVQRTISVLLRYLVG